MERLLEKLRLFVSTIPGLFWVRNINSVTWRFIFVGGFLALMGVLTLVFLVEVINLEKTLANFIQLVFYLEAGFFLHKFFTWKIVEITWKKFLWEWASFNTLRITVLLIEQFLYDLFLWMGVYYVICWFLSSVVGTVMNYYLTNYVVFGKLAYFKDIATKIKIKLNPRS